jgi:hypothetical protein
LPRRGGRTPKAKRAQQCAYQPFEFHMLTTPHLE